MKTSKEEFEKLLDTTLSFDGSYKHEFVYINEDLEFR